MLLFMVLFNGSGLATSANLITNGDFEEGNTGFISQYTHVAGTGSTALWNAGTYTISTNPALYHRDWFPGFGDHTFGTGKMMIANGATFAPLYVWLQNVPLLSQIATYTLYAGQNWAVGNVLVRSDEEGRVFVKFILTDADAIAAGWQISEIQVAVANEVNGIPQSNGNPVPGRFHIKEKLDPGQTETGWYYRPYTWTAGTSMVIAAHAKLELPEIGHMEDTGWVIDREYDSDTGWGGEDSFSGKNWAQYISYVPQALETYTLEFYAASVLVDNPAQLEVTINGLPVSSTFTLPSTVGQWVKYSATWDREAASSAFIIIRNLRLIGPGSDFVIDDITFKQQ
jgi:hypothetical protein